MRWIVPCPAKLNLFLAVGPKDARGYHLLRTFFQAVDLCDELIVELADSTEITFDDPAVPEQNTVSKTVRLLRELVDLPPLRIHVHKRIPSQAGLGGGSSDAAGLIRLAEHVARQNLPAAEKFGLAQTVGSDVPFFLVGGRARGEGYGEELMPLEDVADQWFVICKPPVGCDTARAYARLDERQYDWREFPEDDSLYNDFERVAPCESLELIERLLVHCARDAGLTGSGSAVFGRFASRAMAEFACERMRDEGAEPYLTRSLTRAESLVVRVEPDGRLP